MASYTVKAGDTLSAIATKHNTTVDAIMKLNPQIKNKNLIYAGSVLTLPANQNSKDYSAIGRILEEVIHDIESLDSFNKLVSLIE